MNKQYDRTETSIPFTRKAVARAPCTCGELAQGFLDGEHVVISAPIDRYSVAAALKSPADSPGIGASGVGWEVAAPGFPKTDAVLARAQEAGYRGAPGFLSRTPSADARHRRLGWHDRHPDLSPDDAKPTDS
jgi:hypothetical protein